MSTSTTLDTEAKTAATLQFVDSDIHPTPANRKALHPYLSQRWRQHLDEYGSFSHSFYAARNAFPRFQPNAARLDSWPPNGKPPGADLAFMQKQHLDAHGVKYGILMPLIDTNTSRNNELAAATCAATNAWQLDEFSGKEPRLKASITICAEDPASALAEINRWSGDRHFAQIFLGTRSIEPLGRRRYWPIFAAAQEAGMPIGFHVGGPSAYPPAAGGWPSFYIEYYQIVGHTAQALLTSLILEGVFDAFPTLRIAVVECGFAWVPPFAWRLDKHFERLRSEVPTLKRKPSEYLREHVSFTTQAVEEPENRADLRRLFDWIGWDRMMFSTDYPHWDFDDPRHALQMRMSDDEQRMVFRDNAMRFYAHMDD
jgi:predicted TIM-barrel fold metal-dependent hydrolase